MNKIDRWFKRHDIVSTQRKMEEWGIPVYDYETFFIKMFHQKLTEDELILLEEKIKNTLQEHF